MPKFSVKKPLTVFVCVVVIIVLGVVSYTKMTLDLLPSIDMPYVMVMTSYPGASPQKVEESVSKPLEKTLATLDNIKNIESISAENYSMVLMEFNTKVNMDTISIDIMSDIDMVKPNWEETVGTPYIFKMNPNMIPAVVAAVSYEGKDTKALSSFVNDKLLDEMDGISGVASVNTSGLIQSKINVVISQEKINKINNKLLGKVNSSLADAQKGLLDGKSQLDKAKSKISKGKADLEKSKSSTYDKLSKASAQLDAGVAQVSALKTQIQLLEGTKAALEGQIKYLANGGSMPGVSIDNLRSQLSTVNTQLTALQASSKEAQEQLTGLQDMYEQAERGSYTAIESYSSAMAKMNDAEAQLDTSQKTLDDALAQYQSSSKSAIEAANIGTFVTMDNVSNILKAQNFNMPAGYVSNDDVKYLVSVGDNINSKDEISNLVLFNASGLGDISVDDVADVIMADNSKEVYANINGKSGVLLSFSKQSNYATTESANNIAEKMDQLEEEYDGLKFTTLMSQGDYIYIIVKAIMSSLLWGALFAIIILLLFLRDIRPTIITLCSIPISLTFALVLMYLTGVTINMMSLSGLAVAVGMLVDNSVVVIENTYRLRRQGVPAAKAAVAGAKQVSMAITSSTLTTLCVFVPIIFVEGITRSLFQDMALTIAFSLIASLIIALTLVPSMSSLMLKNVTFKESSRFSKLTEKYKASVNWGLRHKALMLGGAVLLLVASIGISVAKGFIFIPTMSMPSMSGAITTDEDSTLEETISISNKAIDKIMEVEGVESCGGMMANSSSMSMPTGSSDSSSNEVTLYLVLDENTSRTNDAIAKEIDEKCKNLDCKVEIMTSSSITEYSSGLGGNGVSLYLYGENEEKLKAAAKSVGSALEKVDGIDEVDNGIADLEPTYHFTVDKDKAAAKGLTVAQVYAGIAEYLTTEKTATSISWEGNAYDVVVSKGTEEELSIDDVKNINIKVTGQNGAETLVKVKEVAAVKESTALSSVMRLNQKMFLQVNGTLEKGHNVTLVTKDAKAALDKVELPKGVTFELNGENETIMDAMKQLLQMMLLGIILVYGIMVAQFQSLKSPFIIMFTIPLAITGGLLGLIITGKEISAVAMIGFVMLVGIIVNNGIVLVDYINQLRASGMKKLEAIIQGGVTRIRPILMTSLTTVFGLAIMAIGRTAGTDVMQPVAIVCIGGLLYATLLTLYIVPCMYDIMNKEEYKQVTEEDIDTTGIL